jgi:hypothetical protein
MNEKAEDKWPSVHWAYEFVKPSYEWLQNRFDAVNARVEFLLTFSSSITLAIPIVVKVLFPDVIFWSLWFMSAMGMFLLTALVGILGRICGGLKLVSPQKLYNEWLNYSEWEFKKNAIYFAGEHFIYNSSQINRKVNFTIIMSILLVLEVAFIIIWITGLK